MSISACRYDDTSTRDTTPTADVNLSVEDGKLHFKSARATNSYRTTRRLSCCIRTDMNLLAIRRTSR